MSFADASSTRLSYVAESTENSIPGSPTWQNLRFTNEDLNYAKQTVSSEEIRSDRNVPDLANVGFRVEGPVGFELTYGTLDDLLESALFSTWSADVLKNGTTPKTLAFEKTFETGVTDQYLRFTGCQVGSLSLALTAAERITGSLSVMGRGHSTATAALSGATYTGGNTNAVMTASVDVGSLTVAGVSPTPTLRSLNFNIENNLRAQLALANSGPIGIGAGRCVITGSLEAYFENITLYDAFRNHDDAQIQFTLGSTSGQKYTVNMPKCKLSNGRVATPGNDQDVFATFDYQAIYDNSGSPAFDASVSITRAVA